MYRPIDIMQKLFQCIFRCKVQYLFPNRIHKYPWHNLIKLNTILIHSPRRYQPQHHPVQRFICVAHNKHQIIIHTRIDIYLCPIWRYFTVEGS